MFFAISKLFWVLAAPSHWLGLLILACTLCLLLRWLRAARFLALAAVLLLLVAGMVPLHLYIIRALEDQYPRPGWPGHVDGILILGGGYDTSVLRARGAPATNGAAYRLTEAYAAAQHTRTAAEHHTRRWRVWCSAAVLVCWAAWPGRKRRPRAMS
jgi:hypothetical protein